MHDPLQGRDLTPAGAVRPQDVTVGGFLGGTVGGGKMTQQQTNVDTMNDGNYMLGQAFGLNPLLSGGFVATEKQKTQYKLLQ